MIDKNTYVIDMKLPSLNQYIYVCRANKYGASRYKQELQNDIAIFLNRMPSYENPIWIDFFWIEENKKRDYDNICFAKKFILDTMVQLGKIQNDSWGYILGFSDSFCVSKEKTAKVKLTIFEKSREETNGYQGIKNSHRRPIISSGDKKFN